MFGARWKCAFWSVPLDVVVRDDEPGRPPAAGTGGAYAMRQCEATKGDKATNGGEALQHEEWRSETAAILAGAVPFGGPSPWPRCA